MTLSTVDIFHDKQADPSLDGTAPDAAIKALDYNSAHKFNAVTVSTAIGIHVVSGDPNGSLTAGKGELARDTTLGQLWINTSGGSVWTSLVRADGGSANPATLFVTLGDSNTVGVVQTATSTTEFGLDVPDANINFNGHYALASSDPPTFVNINTGPLVPHTDGGVTDAGYYNMVGKTIIQRVGHGAWLSQFAISGTRLADWHPGSTYMLASTGTNLYNTWKLWVQALSAASGRRVGGLIVNLGTNDAVLTGDASAFAARIASIVSQIRSDFGNAGLPVVWIRTHSATDPGTHPFLSTVRAAQDAAPLSIPNFRTVNIDNAKLVGDLLHYTNDTSPSIGDRAATAMLDLAGYPRLSVPGAQADIVSWAPASWGSGNPTPVAPADIKHGDTLLMGVFTGSTVASSIATPSGWTSVVAANATVSGIIQRVALFSLSVTQTILDANDGTIPAVTVTVTGSGDNVAQIFCLRGGSGALFPSIVASSAFIDPTFGTGPSSPTGVTTTGANQRVLIFTGGFTGSNIANMTAVNAALAGVTEVKDQVYNMPDTNFQLIALTKGIKATAGATGTHTVTSATSMILSTITVATT